MSSNRQQLATGLKAILGGANARETQHLPAPHPEILTPEPEAVLSANADSIAPLKQSEDADKAVRKPKTKSTVLTQNAGSRVGTLERPYMRQRDNQPTRKVGVVLPVELADELQIHCVKARLRPNAFIEQAIATALNKRR